MKKVFYVSVLVSLFITSGLKAQDQANNYFVGKWELEMVGPDGPGGDFKIPLTLERQDGQLTGTLMGPGGSPDKIKKVTESENGITIFIDTEMGEMSMTLERVDDNNLKGKMMEMMELKGKRVN